MKSKIYVVIICIISLLITSVLAFLGYFTQSNLTVLVQDEKYVGYKIEQSFRFPWYPEKTYNSIDLSLLKDMWHGGSFTLPSGDYMIYKSIEMGIEHPDFKIQKEIDRLSTENGTMVYPSK